MSVDTGINRITIYFCLTRRLVVVNAIELTAYGDESEVSKFPAGEVSAFFL